MLGSGVHTCNLLDSSRTQGVQTSGAPDPDGVLKEVVRIKIRHYRQLYLNGPDPIALFPLTVDTSGRLYDDFIRLFFLHAHREVSALNNELRRNRISFDFFVLLP